MVEAQTLLEYHERPGCVPRREALCVWATIALLMEVTWVRVWQTEANRYHNQTGMDAVQRWAEDRGL